MEEWKALSVWRGSTLVENWGNVRILFAEHDALGTDFLLIRDHPSYVGAWALFTHFCMYVSLAVVFKFLELRLELFWERVYYFLELFLCVNTHVIYSIRVEQGWVIWICLPLPHRVVFCLTKKHKAHLLIVKLWFWDLLFKWGYLYHLFLLNGFYFIYLSFYLPV